MKKKQTNISDFFKPQTREAHDPISTDNLTTPTNPNPNPNLNPNPNPHLKSSDSCSSRRKARNRAT